MRTTYLGVVILVACALALSAGRAVAQEPTPDDDAGAPALDAIELPVSLERIKRRLAELPETTEGRNLLRLSYYIEVYGRAPAIKVVDGFDLHTGPIPYGSPTHREMLGAMTPRHWRPGAATFSIPR